MSGYVYLIGSSVFKWYKIGKSRTPEVRVADLGILLPFKIKVFGVWKAVDHTALEFELHQKYQYCRINGEWFCFENNEIRELFRMLPEVSRVFPKGNLNSVFSSFSNIEEDRRKGSKVIGVRVQNLRGNFTPQEREERRLASMQRQKEEKLKRRNQLSTVELNHNPFPIDVKLGALVDKPFQGESHDVCTDVCCCN